MDYKTFIFTYYLTKDAKYGKQSHMSTTITAASAPSAVDIFERTIGSLKKNTLVGIQEMAADGTPVGEPIVLKETYDGRQSLSRS